MIVVRWRVVDAMVAKAKRERGAPRGLGVSVKGWEVRRSEEGFRTDSDTR